MGALGPKEFELELRRLADSFFERDGLPEYPFGALLKKELPLEELRDWWHNARMWEVNLIFNQFTLPRLLRLCPTHEDRAALWRVIYPEYGSGDIDAAHPTMARNFFKALGIPEEELPTSLDLDDSLVRERVGNLQKLDYLELLSRFLAPECVGPKIFPAYCEALKAAYGMTDKDVEFYLFHGQEDQEDSAILFRLVCKHAKTEDEQARVKTILIDYFNQDRLRALCVIRPVAFNFESAA